jgi:YD repeat-containing protein
MRPFHVSNNKVFISILFILSICIQTIIFMPEACSGATKEFFERYWEKTSLSLPETAKSTGIATYDIPIAIPPARGVFSPEISINYKSSRKSGWLGVGWDLNIGEVRRSKKFGLNYGLDNFEVLKNGTVIELEARPDWGTDYFGEKFKGSFSTKYFLDRNENQWVATTKEGIVFIYGSEEDTRQDDPDDTTRVFKWCLDEIKDANGNYVKATYSKDEGEIYLSEINYTGNYNDGSFPTNQIIFNPDLSRSDWYAKYDTHFSVTRKKRLGSIEIYGNGEYAGKYVLGYETSSSTRRTLLKSITRFDESNDSLPPITFNYTEVGFDFGEPTTWSAPQFGDQGAVLRMFHPWLGGSFLGGYLDDNMDINGDGLIDKVRFYDTDDPYLRVYLNNGSGFNPSDLWYTPRNTHDEDNNGGAPRVYMGGTTFQDLIDMDGDSLPDRVIRGKYGQLHVYKNNGAGFDTTVKLWNIPDKGGYVYVRNGTETSVSEDMIDMNGDGLPDRVTTGGSDFLKVYLNEGGEGFKEEEILWFTPIADSSWPQSVKNFNSYGVYQDIIDMNGDGLPDRVTNCDDSYLNVYLNNGNGFEETPNTWSSYTRSPSAGNYVYNWNSLGVYQAIIDMNGDGLPDRVQHGGTGNFVVSLNSGKGFNTIIFNWDLDDNDSGYIIRDSDPSYFVYAMVFDVNGDGLADRVTKGGPNYWNVYQNTGSFPDLLNEVHNEYGGKTAMQYKPSTSVEYENEKLPFVYQTVESMTVDDNNGNITGKDFEYKQGYWDDVTRNLWGFEYVKQTNSNDSMSETWYLHDPYYFGRKDRKILKDSEGGAILSETNYQWDKSFIDAENDIAFVKLTQKRTILDDNESYYTQQDISYDDTTQGEFTITTQITGTDAGDPITKMKKYEDQGEWTWRMIEDTVSGKKTVDGTTGIVRKTTFGYDASNGNLLSKQFWLEGGSVDPTTTYAYDENNGNVLTETDPEGNTITYYYEEDVTKTFPTRIEYPTTDNDIVQVVEKSYDYRFGKVKQERKHQKENDQWVENNWTVYDYDGFGRLEGTQYPDGGITIIDYVDGAFPRQVITRAKENETGSTIDMTKYFDGLGRVVKKTSTGIEDGVSRTIVTEKEFHPNENYEISYGPYYENDEANPWVMKTYDDLGRVIETETADSSSGSSVPIISMFDPEGFSVTITDPDICMKKETKDHLGRIVGVTEYADEGELVTLYEYNAAGDLLEVTNALGQKTTIIYDTLGRKTSMDDPDMGVWTYDEYDLNGNLKSQTDQIGQVTEFDYDALNRMRLKTGPAPDPVVEYRYDLGDFGIGS